MTAAPTGTVTFLFTDIEGSTRLWQSQPEQMRHSLARHDVLLRDVVESNGGHVFKTVGDAFYTAFATAPQALEAAVQAQRLLYEEAWEPECPIRDRMALHTGSAEERGGDYFGTTLNRVARLLGAGHGGQVLVSASTQELVRDFVPAGAGLSDLGEHRLKDLTRPERVFQITIHTLPSEFPPLKSLENRPNNLPLQPTPFIGREREVETVGKLLDTSDVRLLTLTGAGGTGKTRLALQAAADRLEEYEDGVYFIDLASLTNPSLVPSAVAHELGVAEVPGQPIQDTLKAHLADKEMLLLLDNFEQVLGAAALVPRLLASSPQLKVIATSRAALRVRGEQEYPVPTLSVPDIRRLPSLGNLSEYDSVRLFVERARSVKPDFKVSSENGPAIAEICYRLDGLPLAIELAAARTRMFPPQSLLSRLASRLKVLTGGARDLPQRQQTLRGAIDWSYELLGEEDKALFARLSVFVGGRSFEAIEAVCNPEEDLDVLSSIESLLEKSLLRQEEGLGGEPRFVMLETIHEYAREKLEECGEEYQRRHAEYFLALAEEGEPELRGPRQGEWLERLEAEHDNLRAALSWSLEGGDSELGQRVAGALYLFWYTRGHLSEGRRWLEDALTAGPDAPAAVFSKALLGTGLLAMAQGDYERARVALVDALGLAREAGDATLTMRALGNASLLDISEGKYDAARQAGAEALAMARAAGDRLHTAHALHTLGGIARMEGEYGRAEELFKEGLTVFREVGDFRLIAMELADLGIVALHEEKPDEAKAYLRESLRLAWSRQDQQTTISGFAELAAVAAVDGDPIRAVRLWAATEVRAEAIGLVIPETVRIAYEPYLLPLRSVLDDTEFRAAWAEGQAMSLEQAVEYALGEP